jgi:hypothetical protein
VTIHVSALRIYPLKAARRVEVDAAIVEPRGLVGDRRWMVVDPDGRALTQREVPALGGLVATLAGDRLRLRAPAGAALEVAIPAAAGPGRTVRLWGAALAAREAPAAAPWLAAALGRPAHLVFQPDDAIRSLDPAYAAAGDHASFADGYPLLLASEASHAEVVRRAGAPLSIERWRANVVVAGAAPDEEDGWRRIRIGGIGFRVAKPCARCVVTTLDPETQARGVEPLRALATYRRLPDGEVGFGQNLIPDGAGSIRVGDPVDVLERA